MIRTAVVGLGKMGISHLALVRAHPDVDLVGVCDASSYVLGVLEKNTGVKTWSDYSKMLDEVELDAVVISTPSASHASMVEAALERGISVFCEKPFTLSAAESSSLAEKAAAKGLTTQVGYHNRFIGAFAEVKQLIDSGAIGEVVHVLGEAYGPVVLKAKGSTWRSKASEGGGCLYDYAAHVINLINWYAGEPEGIGGTVLGKVFSKETDDEVFSTLGFPGGVTGQVSVNWSDESQRKMTTRITVWGTQGRIFADRQEVQAYIREGGSPPGYRTGWNVRYTTELTEPVWFYLRGEEYSAQIDSFFKSVAAGETTGINDFASAAMTDRVIERMAADAANGLNRPTATAPAPAQKKRRWWNRGAK
ncbi:MAG: Gfo/Idh/MocA family oxidoreductase [Actinomycetes bacterium]